MCLHHRPFQGCGRQVGCSRCQGWTMVRRFSLLMLTLPLAAALPAVSAQAQYYPTPPPPPYYRSAPPPGAYEERLPPVIYQDRLPPPGYSADDDDDDVVPPPRRGPRVNQNAAAKPARCAQSHFAVSGRGRRRAGAARLRAAVRPATRLRPSTRSTAAGLSACGKKRPQCDPPAVTNRRSAARTPPRGPYRRPSPRRCRQKTGPKRASRKNCRQI